MDNDITLGDVHIRQHRGPVLEWEMTAASATYDEAARQALLNTVRFRVYQTGGARPHPVNVRGSAGRALIDDARQRIVLLDKVEVYKDGDVELRSGTLDYRIPEGILRASGAVVVKDGESVIAGDTLEYNLLTERAEWTAPVLSQ
jgi:LPS export ABC transporter protein LptC